MINGYSLKGGKAVPNYEDGMVISDPTTAMELLPVTDGFFFGSQEYDQYYLSDIEYTIEVLEDVLKHTDFDKEIVVYNASW